MDRGDRGQWGSTAGAGGGYAGPEVQDGRAFRSFQLHPCGPVELYEAGSILSASAASGHRARFAFAEGELRIDDLRSGNAEGLRLACAAFEYLFATRRHLASIRLAGEGWNALSRGVEAAWPFGRKRHRDLASNDLRGDVLAGAGVLDGLTVSHLPTSRPL